MKKNYKLLLIFVFILAAVLRFYRLGQYPALNADEAALGYNAYSLIKTGADEHGNHWPLHFQSFNDFKPGLYVYLVLPWVTVFGLDVFWIRFPGAFLGVATVIVLFLLVKEIFKNEKMENDKWKIGLIASFFLAINPWHIHFSRGAWEVNVATFFMVTGVYFFLKALRNKSRKNFIFCILSFAFSLYTYHSARVISPLLGLGLLLIYQKKVKKILRAFAFAVIVGVFILIPLIFSLLNGNILSRASGVGLLADRGPVDRINEQRGQHIDINSSSAELLHNKAVNYGLAFFENWGEHYSGEFLFLSGDDIQRNKVPETGQMYLFDILLLPLGFAFIIKKKLRGGVFVLWWMMIAPIAASLTFQSPHALRSQSMVIPLVILSAFGLFYLLLLIRQKYRHNIFVLCSMVFVLLISWNFSRYIHQYWIHMSKEFPFSSQYGIEQLVEYVHENKSEGQKVVVTDRYDQPYILFLFYLKYPPEKFQKEHSLSGRDEYGFSTVREFGDYRFESINFDEVRVQYPNNIIAGTDEEIPDWVNITQEIYGRNGYKYFEVVEN